MAKIEPLADHVNWSVDATLGWVMERSDNIKKVMVIYETDDGAQHVKYSSLTNEEANIMLDIEKMRILLAIFGIRRP